MNVIFDMDGLMFGTERVFIAAWDYAGEKIGIGKAGYMVYKTLGMKQRNSSHWNMYQLRKNEHEQSM